MKAICVHRFGGPEELRLEDVHNPVAAGGQVVVSVASVGVNPLETYVRAGKYGPKEFPYTPGTDAAGVIDSIGPGVDQFKVGQRVYVYHPPGGAYAQKMLCKAEHVHALPDRLSFEQGAAVGVPFATAYRAMFIRGHAQPSQTILIHGASGGVGTAALQLARNLGMTIFGTAGSEQGLALVKSLGATVALNHHEKGYLERLKQITGGKGVDLIIESLANENLEKDLDILARRGRVVVVGSRGKVEIDPRQTMVKDSDIRGMSLMHSDQAELALIHAALGAGFANGSLTPVVGKTFPLEQAPAAHVAVMEGKSNGKIVLTVNR
jgi:NADPH2:quinone reductase